MKSLAIALVLLTASSTAFAQKNLQPTNDVEQRLRQIKELQALVEKLKSDAAAGKQNADIVRLQAEKNRTIALQRQKDLEAQEKRARAIAEKERQIAERRLKEIQQREKNAKGLADKHRRGGKGPLPPHVPKELHAGRERLENLHMAIKHLQAAGMKDLAAEAAKRAEHMQAEMMAAMKHFKPGAEKGHHEKPGAGPQASREIHEALRNLHQQVMELQKAVERLERRK